MARERFGKVIAGPEERRTRYATALTRRFFLGVAFAGLLLIVAITAMPSYNIGRFLVTFELGTFAWAAVVVLLAYVANLYTYKIIYAFKVFFFALHYRQLYQSFSKGIGAMGGQDESVEGEELGQEPDTPTIRRALSLFLAILLNLDAENGRWVEMYQNRLGHMLKERHHHISFISLLYIVLFFWVLLKTPLGSLWMEHVSMYVTATVSAPMAIIFLLGILNVLILFATFAYQVILKPIYRAIPIPRTTLIISLLGIFVPTILQAAEKGGGQVANGASLLISEWPTYFLMALFTIAVVVVVIRIIRSILKRYAAPMEESKEAPFAPPDLDSKERRVEAASRLLANAPDEEKARRLIGIAIQVELARMKPASKGLRHFDRLVGEDNDAEPQQALISILTGGDSIPKDFHGRLARRIEKSLGHGVSISQFLSRSYQLLGLATNEFGKRLPATMTRGEIDESMLVCAVITKDMMAKWEKDQLREEFATLIKLKTRSAWRKGKAEIIVEKAAQKDLEEMIDGNPELQAHRPFMNIRVASRRLLPQEGLLNAAVLEELLAQQLHAATNICVIIPTGLAIITKGLDPRSLLRQSVFIMVDELLRSTFLPFKDVDSLDKAARKVGQYA